MSEHHEYIPKDAIDDFDREEARQFWREQGVLPIEERRQLLWSALGPEKQAERERMLEATTPLTKAIRELPQIQRLHGLRQLGRKTIERDTQVLVGGAVITRPLLHTRFEHSAIIGELALACGVQMGLTQEQTEMNMVAGWFHDSLHPAFSHACDDLLTARGIPGHEDRVEALLGGDNEVNTFLKKFNLTPESVFRIIEEKGAAGNLQRILDTQSYLILDSAATGQNFYPDQGASFIKSLVGFDESGNELVVNDVEQIQKILEYRALMSRDLYFEESNRRGDAALRQLLRVALDRELVTVPQIQHGTDQELLLWLQSLIQHDPGAARMVGRTSTEAPLANYKKLFSLVGGIYDESVWERRVYSSEAEVNNYLIKMAPNRIAQSLVLEPYDFTRKSVTVLLELPDGTREKKRLQAQMVKPLPEQVSEWIVYVPKE